MSLDVIEFIDVSYDELKTSPINKLEIKINENIKSYFEKIPNMSLE